MKRVFFSGKDCSSITLSEHHTVRTVTDYGLWGAALETLPGTKLETGNETNTRCSDTTVINSPTKHNGNTSLFGNTRHSFTQPAPLFMRSKSVLIYTVCTDCAVYRKAKHVVTRTPYRCNFPLISLKNREFGRNSPTF